MSADQKTFALVRVGEPAKGRTEWTSYEVLHDGEGPCVFPQTEESIHAVAARWVAEERARQIERRDCHEGFEWDDGSTCVVAVEVEPGRAVFYRVRLELTRSFVGMLL